MEGLMRGLERFVELDLKTLRYHAAESDATANGSYWHASVNEARAMLQTFVVCVALVGRGESLAELRKGKELQKCYKLCAGYLKASGFIDGDTEFLLQHVCGEGFEPGGDGCFVGAARAAAGVGDDGVSGGAVCVVADVSRGVGEAGGD